MAQLETMKVYHREAEIEMLINVSDFDPAIHLKVESKQPKEPKESKEPKSPKAPKDLKAKDQSKEQSKTEEQKQPE